MVRSDKIDAQFCAEHQASDAQLRIRMLNLSEYGFPHGNSRFCGRAFARDPGGFASFLHQRATRLRRAAGTPSTRNGRQRLCNGPSRPLEFRSFADLEQIQYTCTMRPSSRMQQFLANVLVDRGLLHDLHDGGSVGGARRLHGLQIMRRRRIDAGLRGGSAAGPMRCMKRLEKARGVIVNPSRRLGYQQALRGLEPDAVDIGHEGEQGDIFWPPFMMPNSAACLIVLMVLTARIGEPDHLGFGRLRLQQNPR